MGRAPCCDKASVKKGPWSPEEDKTLKDYIEKHGTGGNWIALPRKAGLKRCGKSCRLRWLNYLRPNIKHGDFSDFEDRVICKLYSGIGSRWSVIAAQLPGRTDNDIKNYWNTKLKKKLMAGVIPPDISSLTRRAVSFVSLHQSSPLASSWLLTSCSLPPAVNPASTNEINFGDNLVQQYNLQKDGFSIAYGTTEPDAACSSSEASNYNFSISTSSIIASENSDQSVSYGYYPNLEVEEKETLVPTSSVGCGWSEGATPEDYGFDEIKQLISTNNITASSSLFDENKVVSSTDYNYIIGVYVCKFKDSKTILFYLQRLALGFCLCVENLIRGCV